MKDTISQRLKQFGMTQECLHKVAENIECLEACQTALEKVLLILLIILTR